MILYRQTLPGHVLVLGMLVAGEASAQRAEPSFRCAASPHAVGEVDLILFPAGDVFCPLLADPKDQHTFVSLISGTFPTLSAFGYDTEIGSVGLADRFNLVRWGPPHGGGGFQIALSGGVFTQFDLRSPSFDLLNADYVVGLPITFRRAGLSLRFRPYHQSSHLGDELVLRIRAEDPDPSQDAVVGVGSGEPASGAFDFEAVDLVVSQELGRTRVYGGGEWLFRRHPETLDDLVMHGGAELRATAFGERQAVVAVDVRAREEYAWRPAWSVRAGVELDTWNDHDHAPRHWQILLEYFDGPPPYGRSFRESLRWFGVGLHLSR